MRPSAARAPFIALTPFVRHAAFLLAGLPALGAAPLAHAADPYPARPVTLATAFAAGSGPDAVLRLVADKLGKTWNQRVPIDKKPGGGGFIAIDAAKRLPQMPEVPTVGESGGPAGLEVNSFVVLLAPRGLPAAVRDKIHADVQAALAEPDIKARFETFAFETLNWPAAEIERKAQLKSTVYAELVKRKNISLD